MTEAEKVALYVLYYGISLQDATEMRKLEAEIEEPYYAVCPERFDPIIDPAVEE
jgi:hypothetical protein